MFSLIRYIYIRILVKINDNKVVIIIDLGVTRNFISRTVVRVANLLIRGKKD